MSRRRTLSTVVIAATLVAALAGCAPTPDPSGSPSTSPSPSQTTAPSPTPTATSDAPVVPTVLPTDCTTLGTDAVRQDAVGDMTLQSDGVGFIRAAPNGAQLALGCDWIIEEVAGVLLLISTAAPADVVTAADALTTEGWTCGVSDDFGATYCSLAPTGNADEEEDQVVARDDVWIYMETHNRNGRAFLSDIAQQIWG